MRWFLFLFLLVPGFSSGQRYDLLLTGGKIIDGTGNGWFYGDVAILDGKIAAVGRLNPAAADSLVDVRGLTIAPGFIDVHTHIERNDLTVPTADNFVFDGVTSVVTGNCGSSHTDIARYFFRLDSVKTSVNVASLIGHNDVRRAVMGDAKREPSGTEQARMESLVEQAMRDGAVGFSTGLIYVPGTYSKTPEVVGLAKAAARYQGIYASHIRSEGDQVDQAIEEAINIGRQAHIPVEISHFKVTFKPNWGRSVFTLEQVDKARREGIDVSVDQYPYVASSTTLNTLLPNWLFSGGGDSLAFRLKDADTRKKVTAEMLKALKKKKFRDYSYALVARYSADTTLNGKSISEVNRLRGRKSRPRYEVETILEMVGNGSAQMVYFSMSEADLKRIMQYPYNMFASDAGIAVYGKDAPHPRTYGTNARVLGHYVRVLNVIRLEEAIRRMTSLPAQKFQLRDRGLIREGMAADLVAFNEQTVIDKSTFSSPHAYSSGFELVIVNGIITMAHGKHTGARNGQILKGPGSVPHY
ncbi:MAG: D-aminoacylase [Chryseosolibacter sp.]